MIPDLHTNDGHANISRRRLMQFASTTTLGLPLAMTSFSSTVDAADERDPLNRFPRMVHEYFVEQVRRAERRKLQATSKLKTKADAEKYVESVRSRIGECFGPEPKRTPLNPRITKVIERDGYRIENLIFDSRPGFPVTANVYVPTDRTGRMPGVIGTCGHSSNGKAEKAYQSFSQGLARQGYVCLIYDPIGQGERLQYVNEDLTAKLRPGVTEHLHAGNQQFLVGETFAMWRAWDGMRALDYLLTRDDVDPNHIGVTGNSGGGTMTTWLCGVERRWTMAAPSCFVTTFRRNMENELPADTEQCPPKALALNLDHDDFIAAMAPRPVVLLAKERDYFDARGAEEAFARLKRLYGLLGAEDKISQFIGPTTHGYSQENREAMYRWFNQATKASDAKTEPKITIEEDETLQCTPSGQVAELDGTRTVFSFTRELSLRLAKKRGNVSGDELKRALRRVLKLRTATDKAPDYRIMRYLSSRDYPKAHAISYGIETEPGIFALTYMLSDERWYSRPPRGGKRAVLYVSHQSSDAELRDEPLIKEVMKAESDALVFACDVRGIGESRPETCGVNSFRSAYGCDYFYAIHSLMLDRPYVGQKTFDVLRVLDWLKSIGRTDVHIVAKGWGALPATFAAVLSDQVNQVTLKNALTSYSDMAETEHYDWPLSSMIPNVLSHFDLPDCYREIASKNLQQIDPWGATVAAGPDTSGN
jgi:dienelactone hydrolase